jgi:outer membrane immunogenic protein
LLLVIGVEGEGAWSGVSSTQDFSAFGGGNSSTTFKNNWDADVAARFGLAYDRFFLYEKIGIAWGDHQFTNTTPGAFGTTIAGGATLPGLLVGTGLEYGLTPQWTAKVEVDAIFFNATDVNQTCSPAVNCGGVTNTTTSWNSTAIIGKMGVNYRW